VRPGDLVARLGGDEFTVLLGPGEGGDGAEVGPDAVAERITLAMRAPLRVDGRAIVVTTSIGIARPAAGDRSGADLLRDADVALYRAKAGGRARAATFDPAWRLAAQVRLQLEADLRRALPGNELRLVFQPKVDLADGRVAAVEVLLRWHRPGHGVLAPGAFLPVAEEIGLAAPIGRWVLREACRHAAGWSGPGPGGPPAVSVNVSAAHLQEPDFVADLGRVLREYDLPGGRVQLEIAEGTLAARVDEVAAVMGKLDRLGIRAVLDDFGTGRADLVALGRLPVSALQLDGRFVAGLPHGREARAIARAVVGLAHGLGTTVVAEGVETADQLAWLRAAGCDGAQGDHVAPPMPADALAAFLTGRREPAPASSVPAVPDASPPADPSLADPTTLPVAPSMVRYGPIRGR